MELPSVIPVIACLYVAPDSVYFTLPGTDPWPSSRDARNYAGPHPIIAHPPCGHWGKYRHRCKQPGRDCLDAALRQLVAHGGIVEHPLGSPVESRIHPLFDRLDIRILRIDQARFGHPSLKPTILIFAGCRPRPLPPPATRMLRPLEHLTHRQRTATPKEFALWLLDSARCSQ